MGMAWCVGSVFPTPDLLTGPAFASPLLDALDPPQHLFDTGCAFRYESFPEAEPHHQVDGFLENFREAFFPKDLIYQHLQEDASLHFESSQSCFKVGNRLDGIENKEGALQLFFPVGENIDRVGSFLLPFERESSGKICKHDGSDMVYSSSLSVRQPILQIAANKVNSPWDSKVACVPLAVRTPYQVHWLTSRFQNNDISLVSRGVETFDCGSSHVVWNPHLSGEAAVVLRNGDVSVFDIASGKSNVTTRVKMQDCRSMEDFSCSLPTLRNKRKRRKFREPAFGTSTKNLWSCEYTWHPRNLLVGGGAEIDLIDLRQKAGSKHFQCGLANAQSSARSFSNCNGMYRTEHFTALARGTHDDVFQFAAASTNHLILYDIRQPKAALLQWEHRMQLEPPGLLQMLYFSDACSKLWNPYDKQLAGGRVILACAFKSGEMQAFPYGPQPQTYHQRAERHMGDLGVAEKSYSWDFPVKLTTPMVQCDENLEHVFEVHGNNMQTLRSTHCGFEKLTGLISSSPCSESSAFTLVQLTGSGSILRQSLHVTEEQGLGTSEQSLSSSKKVPFVRTSPGRRGIKHYRMEYMPACLAFLQNGSVFPEFRRSPYLPGNVCNGTTSLSVELTENKAEKEVHRRFKEYVMPGSTIKDFDEVQLQSSEKNDKGDQSTEEFFRELDSQLCPVNLCFEGTGSSSQSEEQVLLTGFRNLVQQWQQSFQPYITHSKLNTKKTERSS